MPYAVYSKRTGIVSRIVDDLGSLLPSESVLEVDNDVNYARAYMSYIEGQDVNTVGFPLFQNEGGTGLSIQPQRAYTDPVTDRPGTRKNVPVYVKPTDPSGNPRRIQTDLSITSHPFAWTVNELAAVKYESILAQNAPFQVIIGEEFIDEDHIDAASTNYVISEGKCFLAPAGTLITNEFQFQVTNRGVIDPTGSSDEDAKQFVFDTYYLSVEPELPEGIRVYWSGRSWATGALLATPTWNEMITEDSIATTHLNDSDTTATVLYGIQLKFENITPVTFAIENYQLMLRIRNFPAAKAS